MLKLVEYIVKKTKKLLGFDKQGELYAFEGRRVNKIESHW